MSPLCDYQIDQAKYATRLQIAPFYPEQLQPNSYDVRLAGTFFLPVNDESGPTYYGPIQVEEGERVYIPVGGVLLGRTIERVRLGDDLTATVKSRSSVGRAGITVCDDAGFVDAGYDNFVTVELKGYGFGYWPHLVVGECFAQIVFDESGRAKKPYSGQYQISEWPLCMIPRAWRARVAPASAEIEALVKYGKACYNPV